VADFICSISRTIKDKNANTARLFIAKNRNGPDGLVFPMFMDTSIVQMKVLADPQTPKVSPNMSPEDLASALRAKYKQHRQNTKEKGNDVT
jgi:hypothetical protein